MPDNDVAADKTAAVKPARRRLPDLRGCLRKDRCTRSCWKRCCTRCCVCCILFTALLAIVFGIMAAAAKASPSFTSVAVLASPTPMAHRGSIGLWPESTLFTYANTLALHPASVLEFDLRMTKDGHAVVLHDSSTSRTCNGGGQIHELTLTEARALDAGWWWGTAERYARGRDQKKDVEWATYPFRGLGLRIPTFAEVLSTFPNASKLVDLKDQPGASPRVPDALIQAACDAIMAPGISPSQHERVIVASFHEDALVRFRKVCPSVATGQGIMGTAGLWASSVLGTERAYTPSGNTVQGPRFFSLGPLRNVEVMTKRLLDAARNRNLHSSAYDVDGPNQMRLLLGRGIDGLITDRIDLALAVMGYNPSSKVSSLADIKAVGTSCACTAGGNAARLLSEAGCDFIGRLNTPTSASWIAPSTTVACPTAATVLATPKAERWATWDDASCSTCRDVWPCGSIDAPCCVKGVTTTQDAPTSCQADALPLSTVPPKGRMHTEQEL